MQEIAEAVAWRIDPGVGFVVEFEYANYVRCDVEFYTKLNETPARPAFGIGSNVPQQLDIDVCLENLRWWLRTCLGDHPDCQIMESTQNPGRLVDLECFERGYVRLVNYSGCDMSNCWGKAQPMTTTKENIESRLESILAKDLPMTFSEAALITTKLDVRYLWIESLCIVQDDLGDWEVEAAKMATVYGSSYLTIAVLHSPDNQGGCFLERCWRESGASTDSVPVSIRRGETDFTIMTRLKHGGAHDHFLQGGSSDKMPLSSRAWALQERLLSPRTLLIRPEELVWECRSAMLCECRGLQRGTTGIAPRPGLPHGGLEERIQPRNNSAANVAGANWLEVISAYSVLKLTKASDILPGLGGLAAHFSEFMAGEFIGGLRSDDFPRSLLWECLRSTELNPEHNSTASWSWTAVCSGSSLDGGIWYEEALSAGKFIADARFKLVIDRIAATPPSIRGSNGALHISGALIEIEYQRRLFDDNHNHAKIFRSHQCRIQLDDSKYRLQVGECVGCLLLGTTPPTAEYELRSEGFSSALHILLLKMHGTGDGLYRRLGVLTIHRRNQGIEDLRNRFDRVIPTNIKLA